MPAHPISPDSAQILPVIRENGRIRRSQLLEELKEPSVDNPRLLDSPLMLLVEQGEISIFPMGEEVMLRYED